MSLGAESLLSQDSGVLPLKNTPSRRTKFTVLILPACPSSPDLCPKLHPTLPVLSPPLSFSGIPVKSDIWIYPLS